MQKENIELLMKAKEFIKNEIPIISYDTWIESLEIESFVENNIILIAKSSFQKEFIESKYIDLISNTFKFLTNKNCNVIVTEKKDSKVQTNYQNENNFVYSKNNLNTKYTFESFVIGESNKFAVAAALAVAEAPGTAYNPLFLYGGSGLGKTHLMHAIGNFVINNNKNLNVLYLTAEKFTNELVNSLKDVKMDQFRDKYRRIDLLLIDDIQFLAGKDRTQEEFFHTFNALHDDGKQVVISSDKPPRDIYPIEERLKSRFEWGILADVSVPDYETRLAILRKKTQTENIVVDDAVLSNIALKIESNVRELEGALNKVFVQASLEHTPISLEMSEKAINDLVVSKQKVISCEYVQEIISRYFNISVFDLQSSKRSNDIAYARQIAMFLCRELLGIPYKQIGKEFGGRDHSTVMFAFTKIDSEIKENGETKLIVDSVKNIINNK